MTSRDTFKMEPPQQVFDSYRSIRDSDLILKKSLNDDSIKEFQDYLNASQPCNEEESKSRSLIQYLYRKNPTNFCRFLVRSRLHHLILWTEAKCIVRHFGLRGVVYVKWNDKEYECSLHRNINYSHDTYSGDQHPSAQKTYHTVEGDNDRSTSRYQRNDRRHRGERRDRSGYRNKQHYYGEQQQTNIHKFPEVNEELFPTLSTRLKSVTPTPVNSLSSKTFKESTSDLSSNSSNDNEGQNNQNELTASVVDFLTKSTEHNETPESSTITNTTTKGISQYSYSKALQS